MHIYIRIYSISIFHHWTYLYVITQHTTVKYMSSLNILISDQYQSITRSTKCMPIIGMTVTIITLIVMMIIVEWRLIKSKWDSWWQFISLRSIHLSHYNSTQYLKYLTFSLSLILAFASSMRYFTTLKHPSFAANIKGDWFSWKLNRTTTSYVIQW
jgi:hypothetical protein